MSGAALFLALTAALTGCSRPETPAPAATPTPSPVPLPGSAFRLQWGHAHVPKIMTAGRTVSVAVIVKNVGDAVWPDRAHGHPSGNGMGAVRLAYRWWRAGPPPELVADYAPRERGELPAPVEPGATTRLTIAVRAPSPPGAYLLQLELLQEMVSWFETRGAATLKVPVEVSGEETGPNPDPEVRSASPTTTAAASSTGVRTGSRPALRLPPAPHNLLPLWTLLAAGAFIAIVPLAFGYLVAGRADHAPGAERLAWMYVIGFAALVFALGAAATFFPARVHGPVLAGGSLALLLLIRGARAPLIEDLRRGWRPVAIVLAIAAAGMAALNYPSLAAGDTVFFDGHGNHDGFYNVGNASWLLDHNARDTPEWSVAAPLYSPVLYLIGLRSVVTRLGAESLLAAAAAATRLDPLYIYLPLLSALLLPWLATAFLILRRAWPHGSFPLALLVLLGAFQPLFLFFFANGNFPNLVGLLPSTLLLLLFRWQQTEARPPFGLRAIALATAAPLATYPEVLAVTCVGIAILMVASLPRIPLAGTARAALGMAAGAALNPLVAWRSWSGLRTSMAANSSMAGGEPWFAMLTPSQILPAGVTLSFHAAKALPMAAAVLVSLCILVAMLVAWRRMEDRALGWALIVPLAAVCALGWHRSMPYAYQKSVQWTALLVDVVMAAGIMECLRRPGAAGKPWPTVKGWGGAAAGAVCALWLVAASAWGMRWMLAIAETKRIDAAVREVGEMAREVPTGAAITVRDEPLGEDGFFAMWIPYFIRDHPLFFESGEATANYLSTLVRHSSRVPLAPPPYILAPAGSPPLEGETPIVANRRFQLLAAHTDSPPPALGPLRRVPLTVDGLAVISRIGTLSPLPDGSFTVPAGSGEMTVEGAALLTGGHGCPREVYLGMVDEDGRMAQVALAERFVWTAYATNFNLPADTACGFRARVEPARLPPGTYSFRAFQLATDRGFYTNAVGDPRLVVGP